MRRGNKSFTVGAICYCGYHTLSVNRTEDYIPRVRKTLYEGGVYAN